MSTCWAFFDLYVSLWVAVQNIKAFLTLFHWKKIFILSLIAIWQKNWLRLINFPNREIKLLLYTYICSRKTLDCQRFETKTFLEWAMYLEGHYTRLHTWNMLTPWLMMSYFLTHSYSECNLHQQLTCNLQMQLYVFYDCCSSTLVQ